MTESNIQNNKAQCPLAPATLLGDGEQFKYLEVEITRTQGTLVFLKVPKDFNHRACVNLKEILRDAAIETCDESDWRLGSDQWEDTVEWQAIKEVPKTEAEAYVMYEVKSPNVDLSHRASINQNQTTEI
jgi:hypothetical protein